MRVLTAIRCHAVRQNPKKYVLAERTVEGDLRPANIPMDYARTVPVTFRGET